MPEAKRKYALECLRLQASCMQLACDTQDYNAQKRFVAMAHHWSGLAAGDLELNLACNLSGAETRST